MSATRPLEEAQRELLSFILSFDFPGVDALRVQARSVQVVNDGIEDPTFLVLEVADPAAPLAVVDGHVLHKSRRSGGRYGSPVAEAATAENTSPPWLLLLFVKDGQLACLELADMADQGFTTYPKPEAFDPPFETL